VVVLEVNGEEIPEGRAWPVRAGGRDLLIVRWRDELFAVRNVCPHMSCSMARGRVVARAASSTVGEMGTDDDRPTIQCPWHNYDFDLRTGRCFSDRSLRVKTYRVTRDGDRLIID
jgi:3-phenylpropionate/trans-cinnamate dioxygenase ferredoxin subunit